MKIEMKITKRDILLLFLLGIFLFVMAIYWFLLRPLGEKADDYEMKIAALEDEKNRYLIYSSGISGLESSLDSAKKEYDTLYASMLKADKTDEINAYVARTVRNYGLKTYNFYITEDIETDRGGNPIDISLLPYSHSSLYESEKANEWKRFRELAGIRSYSVTMQIVGDKEKIQELIDLFAGGTDQTTEEGEIAYPSIRLESYRWSKEDTIEITGRVYVVSARSETEGA